MIQLVASILLGKQAEDFEGWAGGVIAEILLELVIVVVLAVVYVF